MKNNNSSILFLSYITYQELFTDNNLYNWEAYYTIKIVSFDLLFKRLFLNSKTKF